MARNKYPEATVKKILDVAERPFVERGNEHTTMADIVESLGGLTKGAVYHHSRKRTRFSRRSSSVPPVESWLAPDEILATDFMDSFSL